MSGRIRSSQRGCAQATGPSRRSSTGISTSRIRRGVEQDGDAEDHAHLLGRQRPGEREGEEDRHHHGGGREDHAPGVGDAADHRVLRVAGAVPVLLRRGEQEDRVVHRDGEDHREEEDRPPGVEEALRLEAEEAGAVPLLEDQPGDAEGGRRGEQVRDDTRQPRSQAPAARAAGAGSRARARLRRRAASARRAPASRSWFSATEPPTSAPAGKAARSRSIVSPTAGSDGSTVGTAWSRALDVDSPAATTCAMPASLRSDLGGRLGGVARDDDLERAGCARAEGRLDEVVAAAGRVLRRDDLDRGHPGLQPDRGERRARRAAPWPRAPRRRGAARAARPSARTRESGARRRAPTRGRAGRRAGRASRARPAAGSASPRARRSPRA